MSISLTPAYYSKCIPQDVLASVLEFFSDDDPKQVAKQLDSMFDHIALRTVLTHLESNADRVAFLELCRDEHQSTSPLDWAILKIDNIEVRLQESLERSLLALYQKLQTSGKTTT